MTCRKIIIFAKYVSNTSVHHIKLPTSNPFNPARILIHHLKLVKFKERGGEINSRKKHEQKTINT